MIDADHLQEGKIDPDPNIRCNECGELYHLDYWQRMRGPLGPTTEFVCEMCAYINGQKSDHKILDHFEQS